jgi:hypothetical protein
LVSSVSIPSAFHSQAEIRRHRRARKKLVYVLTTISNLYFVEIKDYGKNNATGGSRRTPRYTGMKVEWAVGGGRRKYDI